MKISVVLLECFWMIFNFALFQYLDIYVCCYVMYVEFMYYIVILAYNPDSMLVQQL